MLKNLSAFFVASFVFSFGVGIPGSGNATEHNADERHVTGSHAQTMGCMKKSCGGLVDFPGDIDKMPVQVWCKNRQTGDYVQATNMDMNEPPHTNCDYGPSPSGPDSLWLEMKCASHVPKLQEGSVSWDCPSLP